MTAVHLSPLDSDDTRRLIIEASPDPLSDGTIDLIIERAEGNPLFALELAKAAGSGDHAELPDSVEQVIASRVDALPPVLRHLVRVASVFGNTFDATDITAAHDEAIAETSIADAGLRDIVERGTGTSWSFRHALYRDAIYAALPYRRRRELHGLIGRHLESRSADPDASAPLLSLHFSEAADWDAAWHYSRVAGRQAASQYAFTEAAAAYTRAMAAAKRLRSLPASERRDVAERLGDALLAVGRYDAAFAAFGSARRWATPIEEIDLMRRQGMVRDRQGSITAAIRWYERCLRRLTNSTSSLDARRTHLHVALAYAAARHRQGRFPECLEWAKRAEADAIALGDTASQAKALDRLHVAATYLGLPEAEGYGPAALELHRSLGDHLSQARILDNMGIQAYFAYRWDDAVALYGEAAEAGQLAGDVIEANLGRLNAAEVLSDRGRHAEAAAEFREVLRNWQAARWVFGRAAAMSNLGLALCRERSPEDGVALLVDALEQFEQLGAQEFITEIPMRLAEAHVHLGDPAAARRHAEHALQLVTDDRGRARTLRQLGAASLLEGDRSAALEALTESVRLANGTGAKYEEGLSLALLAGMTDDEVQSDRAATILCELGVVELPPALIELGANRPT